jgi:hypothetical protein
LKNIISKNNIKYKKMEKGILNDLLNITVSNLFTNKEKIYYIFKMKNKNI